MNFNAEHLTQAFELMALGMGGVFLVLGILYAVSALFIKSIPAKIRRPFHGKFHSQTVMARSR